jgi:hypothetical protein
MNMDAWRDSVVVSLRRRNFVCAMARRSTTASILIAWLLFALIDGGAQQVFAQLAPTGQHYAGRAADTGYGGTVANATGAFATGIPLEFPPARGGLPIPVQITYGARGIGAAGLGWDVPLSYIQHDGTFAHRRPASSAGALPTPRERAYLSLLGQSLELVRNGSDWVARSGTLEITARESASSWLAYDGQGRTYRFTRPTGLGSTSLWLLESVSVAGGASIELTYEIGTTRLDGGLGITIDLRRIHYNFLVHKTATVFKQGCAKHEIALEYEYGNDSHTPLAISVLGDKILARKKTLLFVDVNSRPTCDTPYERLRRYHFKYESDTDTELPRLHTVRMFGRQGTPEQHTALPIASYSYGSATQDGRLHYERTQTIALPAGSVSNPQIPIPGAARTALDSSVNAPVAGDRYAMWQTLTDVTGDGRPDLVFKRNDKLWVAYNRPGPNGSTTLGVGPGAIAPLSDFTFKKGAFSTHTTVKRRFNYAAGATNRNTTNVWRQAIDVNGDGRIDIIDAAEEPNRWVVYLNTPGPTGVKWERRSFSVSALRAELARHGHVINGPNVPLSRRATGTDLRSFECWRWDGNNWKWWSQGFANHRCASGAIKDEDRGPERTFIEWELTDLNGDGYPDFVFNSTPVELQVNPPRRPRPVVDPPLPPGRVYPTDFGVGGPIWHRFAPRWTNEPSSTDPGPHSINEVRVSFNVVGVRFDTDQDPFSRSVSLQHVEASDAGVGGWGCDGHPAFLNFGNTCDASHQRQWVAFADVNGDGLVDRIVNYRAYLGVYSGTAVSFSPVYITLPGPLATQQNTFKADCLDAGGHLKPTAEQTNKQTQGLRDLTGDGIPDYYDSTPDQNGREWSRVSIGTGTGFRQPIPIKMPGSDTFVFSHQTESCNGSDSSTDGGLFDIDGDGRPEVVGLDVNPTESKLIVSQLVGDRVSADPKPDA